jgi:Ni/Co efflux regulator RcnB
MYANVQNAQVTNGTIATGKLAEEIDMKTNCTLAFVIAGALVIGQAIADKPPWAGGGKGGKSENSERRESPGNSQGRQGNGDERSRDHTGTTARSGEHFGDRQRTIVHDYYAGQFRGGHCPPGLAKKHNGCMPPGQAKKWSVGRPLPREVIYYDVPPALVVQFDRPPTGYRYVRVASDILLIALGTGMVIDAIQDLGRM